MKNPKFAKFNILGVLIGLVLVFVSINSTAAQQSLPAGGNSFETAVFLGPGTYQGSLAEDETAFYRVQANAGQEIKIETNSGDTWLVIYNDEKEELQFSGSDRFVHWLPNSEKSAHSFYLKISNEAWETISFTLKISLINRYDANSQKDAGDTFEESLDITTGEYQGYLAGYYPAMTPKGDDFKDYYKTPVKKGVTYTFKATPPSADEISLELFSLNRESIDQKSSANPGAIVNLSLTPAADTNIFILIEHEGPISGEVLNYKLNIDTSTPLTKFYVCKGESCESVGEFVSKADCQKSTTKTCYQTENCDNKCGTPAPTPGPTPGPTSEPTPGPTPGPTPEPTLEPTPGPIEFEPEAYWPTYAPSITLIWKWIVGYLVLWIILYIYFALCLYFLAKKTNTPNEWLAWIPIANVFLMLQVAQKPLWWFILLLIPLVNIVIGIIVWMAIAERRGKPNWWGILVIVPFVGLIVPGYLAFSDKEKIEITLPYAPTGTEEAHKPVVGYKHPCKYCGKLIPPNSTVCPFCGKTNPLGPYRCPKCHEPVEKDWKVCPRCNQNLRIVCPFCGKITFFGDHCEDCGARLLVKCPHCGQEQPPISDNCIKCGKALQKK